MRRKMMKAAALALVGVMATATAALAADTHDSLSVSSEVEDPTTVYAGQGNAFEITVWATGNVNENNSQDDTGQVEVTTEYFMNELGDITPGAVTETLQFEVGTNYSQDCSGTAADPKGCEANPFVVDATLFVHADTPKDTEAEIEAVLSYGHRMDQGTHAVGYVIVDILSSDYVFTGFYAPVADVNKAKAGQGVPLKWNLYEGSVAAENEVIDPTRGEDHYTITSKKVTCALADGDSADVSADDAGKSDLRYDFIVGLEDAAGQNIFVWKTNKDWAKTCREISVSYNGSDPLTAVFEFQK